MPKKNIKGGKKHKKTANAREYNEKTMVYKENSNEEYALVMDLVGNGNIRVKLSSGNTMISRIPGSFKKKKIFINKGNILLIALREFEQDKSDIIYKYSDGQSKQLQKNDVLPSWFFNFNTIQQINNDVNENDVIFKDDDEDVEIKTKKPRPIDRSKRMGEITCNDNDSYTFDVEEI